MASFDPTDSSVLLWTRVDAPAAGAPVPLQWTLARDADLQQVVASGAVEATAEGGHCVRVEVDDLDAGSGWWYGFTTRDGATSPVGRTRTMPSAAGAGLRVGVVSCSRFAAGGFAAYRALAEREVDVVVHVGDYIYEDGGHGLRRHEPPHRVVDLDGYRTRYAQHRSDPDLQALHARHPMVAVWDDHDVAGNAWRDGAAEHDDELDGPWIERVVAASVAHDEWLPGRTGFGDDGRLRAWRSLRFGDLAELIVLDTRLWGRDRQPRDAAELEAGAASRSLLGADQAAFVAERLAAPDRAPWTLLANQVMFHPLQVPVPGDALTRQVESAGLIVVDGQAVNPDQWDGYPQAREQISVAIGGRGGAVVLTGDVHSSWAWEGPANDAGQPAMVELVAPSVSSEPFADLLPVPGGIVEPLLADVSEGLSYVELSSHGYLLVDLSEERVQGEWWYVDPGDPGTQRLGAVRTAPREVPMRLSEATEATADPRRPDRPTATTAPVPSQSIEDGVPVGLVAGVGTVAAAAVAAALIALRRRRS